MSKLTGGPSEYYLVPVPKPRRKTLKAYVAECQDLMAALALSWSEGNVFKALWRVARHRAGRGKEGTDARYDVEKLVYFAGCVALEFGLTEDEILKALALRQELAVKEAEQEKPRNPLLSHCLHCAVQGHAFCQCSDSTRGSSYDT